MGRFGGSFFLTILIVATALASLASGVAVADQAAPRPVLILESVSPMHLTLPPGGLHFALYDDGQVIAHSKEYGRGLIYGRLDPADAEGLRHDVAEDLRGVSGLQPPNSGVADDGVAALHIWNGQNYSKYAGSAAACLSGKMPAGGGILLEVWRHVRERTDSRFLKVCDQLSLYAIASPQPWPLNRAELWDIRPWFQ